MRRKALKRRARPVLCSASHRSEGLAKNARRNSRWHHGKRVKEAERGSADVSTVGPGPLQGCVRQYDTVKDQEGSRRGERRGSGLLRRRDLCGLWGGEKRGNPVERFFHHHFWHYTHTFSFKDIFKSFPILWNWTPYF